MLLTASCLCLGDTSFQNHLCSLFLFYRVHLFIHLFENEMERKLIIVCLKFKPSIWGANSVYKIYFSNLICNIEINMKTNSEPQANTNLLLNPHSGVSLEATITLINNSWVIMKLHRITGGKNKHWYLNTYIHTQCFIWYWRFSDVSIYNQETVIIT